MKALWGRLERREFIHDAIADEPDLALLFLLCRGWVGGHNDADEWAVPVQVLVWTIVKRAADPAFRAQEVLIRRQVQASLDVGAIKEAVVFATGDIREIAQITDNRPIAILAIETDEGH